MKLRLAAVAAFVAVTLALWGQSGTRIGADTSLYVEGARQLLAGEPVTGRAASYAGYVAVIAATRGLLAPDAAVVLLQILAAAVAALAVAAMAGRLGGEQAAWLAAALLAIDVETSRWHTYVLSDSLYASALTLAVWCTYRAANTVFSVRGFAMAMGVTVCAALIRPEGWFLLPVVAVYLAIGAPSGRSRLLVLSSAVAVVIAAIAIVTPRLESNVSAIGPNTMLRQGTTIWSYDGWRVAMPAEASGGGSEAQEAIAYALRHPVSTSLLMTTRVGVHMAHVRPFYSAAHNVVILAWLLPVYALAIMGWRATARHQLARWCAIAVLSQTVVVAVGHADWDGRYLAHVMPLIYPCAACGAIRALRRGNYSSGSPDRLVEPGPFGV